jgi:hypothetical protein
VLSSDLPGVNSAKLNGMILYYRLMTKWSGLGDSTELSRVGLSHSRCVAYLDSLPFQEGTPLSPTDEHTSTEVVTTDSGLGTPNRQVFMAGGETLGPSGTRPDRYFDDMSADELSANAPANETNDDKNAWRERNRK